MCISKGFSHVHQNQNLNGLWTRGEDETQQEDSNFESKTLVKLDKIMKKLNEIANALNIPQIVE